MNNTAWFFSEKAILNNKLDDFIKIFLPTILVAVLLLLFPLEKNEIFLFIIFYFLDAGHIFSTFLETAIDKKQLKSKKIIQASLLAFSLNLIASYIFPGGFFIYLFYFTIFHNLRQGLGIFLLHSKVDSISRNQLSLFYYVGTIVPVILFHFKGLYLGTDLTYSLRPIDLNLFFSETIMKSIFEYGKAIYILGYSFLLVFLFIKRTKGLFTFIFFTLIYSLVFLLVNNIVVGMILLVISHGLPYLFIFNKRISLTHSSSIIKKHSLFFVILLFFIGALLEFTQEDISFLFPNHIRNIIFSITFFPMVAHYIYDMFLWKNENANFQIFKKNMN